MDVLVRLFNNYLEHRSIISELKTSKFKHTVRYPNFPELISETLCMNILNTIIGGVTNKTISGDLCYGDKKIEVKALSSDGPMSFGPNEKWDELYVMDVREIRSFVLYQCPFSSSSTEFGNVLVNKRETYKDHCSQGRRPRITFNCLYPQIKMTKVAEGLVIDALNTDLKNVQIYKSMFDRNGENPEEDILEIDVFYLRVADFFAGVGGFHHGIEGSKENAEIVVANDMDENCMKTYKANFSSPFILKDISNIDSKELPDFDMFCGGFPCQPFSIAGKQKGFDDDRGQVFFQIVRILRDKKPGVILLENVKNLSTHDDGNTLTVIKRELSELGYHIKHEILNACTHGNTPQNRERIFIVGFLDKDKCDRFTFPPKIPLTISVKDILEKNVDSKYYYTPTSVIYPKLAEAVIDRDIVYQYRRQYVRANKSGVCPTLTANMGGGGHNVPIILDHKGIRKLTPRECFALQGFSNIRLPSGLADCHLYKQAGNSVNAVVIRRICTNICSVLKN